MDYVGLSCSTLAHDDGAILFDKDQTYISNLFVALICRICYRTKHHIYAPIPIRKMAEIQLGGMRAVNYGLLVFENAPPTGRGTILLRNQKS